MSLGGMAHQLALQARRIGQTPAHFRNWPSLLVGIGASRVGRGPAELTFRPRGARPTITVPNTKGAFVPSYEVFAEDCYHLEWFLGDLLTRRIHVIDVGAHVGTFACDLATRHPGATIDCYEPADSTADFLERNVGDNALAHRIRVHRAAVAGETGYAAFEQQGMASGLNHLAFDQADTGPVAVEELVRTVAFDELVAEAAAPVEVVKMDCEGGEYDLVLRSSPASWATVRRVVLEYHRVPGQTWASLRDWFAAAGLTVVREEEQVPGLGLAWLSRDPLPAYS